MLFNSYEFIFVFLPLTLAGFFALARRGGGRAAMAWLVVASLAFYGWWNPAYVPLLLGSVLANYGLGRYLARCSRTGGQSAGRPGGRAVLILGIAGNLVLLGYYKYAGFLAGTAGALTGADLGLDGIVLPLAISFFTFQQIAFLVDAYRGEAAEPGLLRYGLFICFFPQLIAGPIVHHREMLPQFGRARTFQFNPANAAVGVTVFSIGLVKKAVLADGIGAHARPVFDAAAAGAAPDLLTAWSGALAYTFQLYFDFSGYTDMAIGAALLFNIRLPPNFDAPYKATSIIDFWRRWHMTLSRFLRDYIYIPLGGNRHGEPRRYANLMTTMLLGGLWHGAGWTFILWGGLQLLMASVLLLSGGLYALRTLSILAAFPFMLLMIVMAWSLYRDLAREWFERFEGAGLDGLIAKRRELTYQPDKRVMSKVKHERTADCVVAGYRVHTSGPDAVGSLLLGLHDERCGARCWLLVAPFAYLSGIRAGGQRSSSPLIIRLRHVYAVVSQAALADHHRAGAGARLRRRRRHLRLGRVHRGLDRALRHDLPESAQAHRRPPHLGLADHRGGLVVRPEEALAHRRQDDRHLHHHHGHRARGGPDDRQRDEPGGDRPGGDARAARGDLPR